ncbi:MAG TPA: protein kinase [Gemmatimonadales bacterium]|nr:protein kinase [Gemmatimonadales bacterium]
MPSSLATALAGRYALERKLGEGGMATVYLAQDIRHGRKVAIKVLRPELAAVLGPERFLNEIRITAGLDHPHILTLLDSGQSNGFLWYVLPFVRGESLADKLQREQQLGLDDALSITRQMASALDFAHQRGVIHRDVKPQNILLHEGEAVLADFGIALAVREAGGNRLTETGLSLGTPEYMSPEQATGNRQLDTRSDVYSLAAVLYEMLAGEPPHTGPTAHAVIAKLMTERPTRLRVVRDTVPDAVDQAVAKALAKTPADRFASAGEFVRALSGSGVMETRAPRRLRFSPTLGAGIVVLAVITWAVLRQPTPRVIQPTREQLTFSGNARTPALSWDGRRLAYTTKQCDDQGSCTADLVVQDLGGAGLATVARGWAGVWGLEWSGDGRYLLVSGYRRSDQTWGLFAVPVLGGEPRKLANAQNGAMVGSSDTVLGITEIGGDSLTWLRWITIGDGVTRDSLALPHRPGYWIQTWPFPDGRRILIVRAGPRGQSCAIVDRSGRLGDSIPISLFNLPIGLGDAGQSLLVRAPPDPTEDEFDILAYRVGRSGRIDPRPDTVLRDLKGKPSITPSGMLLLAEGPVQREVWALRWDGSRSMRFERRLLASATSVLWGALSPSGDRVLLTRTILQGDRPAKQLSLVPFDGGIETPLSHMRDFKIAFWGADGTSVFLLNKLASDSISFEEMDLASGRSRKRYAFWSSEMTSRPHPLPGGGVALGVLSPGGIRRVGVPGLPDTTFALGDVGIGGVALAESPEGRAVVWLRSDATGDSILVDRVSLVDGTRRRLAWFFAEGGNAPFWLNDGTLLVQIKETSATLVWYRIPMTGGAPIRLGVPPWFPANYDISRDGRHIVAEVREDRPDAYLIRNFPDLVRH